MRSPLPLALTFVAAAAPAAEKKPFTVDDLWSIHRVGAPVVSPDGRSVAYTVSVFDTWVRSRTSRSRERGAPRCRCSSSTLPASTGARSTHSSTWSTADPSAPPPTAGHTDRFKALVSHAGVYDLLGQWASDATWGRHHSYGGYPFTDLANTERWSPNRFAARFKTPMLILHGERDFRVPVTQGLELYGVLVAKGVPARLVYYADENHWILKGQNAKHWYGEVMGFLATHLK